MKHKKLVIILSVLALTLSIVTAVIDHYVLEGDGYGLTFGIAMLISLIILPAALIITTLYGAGKITKSLASNKVSSSEKRGILKRMLIVIVVAALALGIFGIINALGTALIDI